MQQNKIILRHRKIKAAHRLESTLLKFNCVKKFNKKAGCSYRMNRVQCSL